MKVSKKKGREGQGMRNWKWWEWEREESDTKEEIKLRELDWGGLKMEEQRRRQEIQGQGSCHLTVVSLGSRFSFRVCF